MNKQEVDVVAGVIIRHDGRFLLGQRAPGSFYPGYWEFPGGKIEPGESPEKALRRELKEELGIDISRFYPWIVRTHCYEHARVKLRFFEVAQWQGEPHPHVHDNLCWLTPGQNMPSPILPANGPVLKALTLPRRMGITQAAAIGCDAQLAALNRALDAGLRLIQIREKALPASARREFVREAVRRIHAAGALAMVNGEPALAHESHADGLHLTAAQLMTYSKRPSFEWVGASCHTRAELEQASALELDYVLIGAVKATPTHPEQAPLGWAGFTALASGLPMPVFALGGLEYADMETARNAGAHGIAAIRGAWDKT